MLCASDPPTAGEQRAGGVGADGEINYSSNGALGLAYRVRVDVQRTADELGKFACRQTLKDGHLLDIIAVGNLCGPGQARRWAGGWPRQQRRRESKAGAHVSEVISEHRGLGPHGRIAALWENTKSARVATRAVCTRAGGLVAATGGGLRLLRNNTKAKAGTYVEYDDARHGEVAEPASLLARRSRIIL